MNSELDNFEQELMMEEQDEKAVEGLRKCEHGIYIARGDSRAEYCTACNPGYSSIMRKPTRVSLATKSERTLDTVEYFEQPLSERLAFAAQLENITL